MLPIVLTYYYVSNVFTLIILKFCIDTLNKEKQGLVQDYTQRL